MHTGHISKTALAVALAFVVAPQAQAADAGNEEGDAIIVTGKSLEETLPQELSRYGNDITIIDEKQIRNSGALDAAKILETLPGLYIRSGSGPFDYVDVAMQGSRTQDVLWTMDGIRLNNRLYGGTSPNDTLPASMIERIEVLKGGESLFYGTQAAAGIINVVTRGFTDDFNGQINGSIDTRASNSIDGYVRGGVKGHRFIVYGSHNQAEGFRPYSVMQPSATDRKRGYNNWSAGLKYQYDLTPDLALNLQYQHTEAKLDNLSASRINESRNDRNEEIAAARLDYTGNDTVQFFLKGYFHDWKTAYVQIVNPVPPGPPVVIYPPDTFWGYQDYGANAVIKLRPHRGLEYLLGYDFQSFNGRDDVLLIAPTNEKVHAGIFQVRTTDDLSSKGRLAAGLRYNKAGGAEKAVWNVSGAYNFSDHVFVEANGGTSFVLPDASQLYGNDPCCELGNPNLKPEESLNINVSIGGIVPMGDGRLRWKATYFNRRIKNLIDYFYPDSDDPLFAQYPNGVAVNVDGTVKASGAELELGYATPGGWSISASYTYSRVRNPGATAQRDRNPESYAKGGIAYAPADKPFGANVQVNWTGNVYSTAAGFGRLNSGNYALVDVGAHVYLDGASRRHRLAVNIENLFDKDYATRGYQSGFVDGSTTDRFLYFRRGVPFTARFSYGLSF